MRTTHAFVLRLLADSDEPDVLRGTVRSVASGEEAPFADGPALTSLLKRMIADAPAIAPLDSEERGDGES